MKNIEQIKKLREETDAGVLDIKKALDEAGGDIEKAKEILRKMGFEKAEKKAARKTADGLVFSYIHATGKVGSILSLMCETDFVAKTEAFNKLGKELAMQIAAMDPKDVDELLNQAYIRDASKNVEELIKEVIAKVGENIKVGEFRRVEI